MPTTDLYTKAMLTLIAGCLLAITFRDSPVEFVPTALAVEGIQRPTPSKVSIDGVIDVNVVQICGQSLSYLDHERLPSNRYAIPVRTTK